MTDRETLTKLIYNASPRLVEEEAASLANRLTANGVVVREKGEWTPHGFCPFCKVEAITEWDECGGAQIKTNFCPNCGSDMRKEVQA